MTWNGTRREFLKTGTALGTGTLLSPALFAQAPSGDRPSSTSPVTILSPRSRVPMSFIIDDSTCLVNMGTYCMPQFAAVYPEREIYQKPWRTRPREIPDAFVREFGEWCAAQGVKGKYSIVPYPACVGWLDRELPGWSRDQLRDSLKLVRELMLPSWDIHPEMITHTRVIDLKTGRPMEEISPATMENSYPQQKKSVDELAAYMAYALKILKNCELPCEGITTPGGFGNLVKSELSLAVQQAVKDVFPVEIPHYFKYVKTGDESTEPYLEHVSGVGTDNIGLTVNVPAGTGDWFGSWHGTAVPEPDRYANRDATSGRLVELIEQGRPALMLCHWQGMYCNGSKLGFHSLRQVITAIHGRFADRIVWMKLSEIARYQAAKELTTWQLEDDVLRAQAPFACPSMTFSFPAREHMPPFSWNQTPLRQVSHRRELVVGSWLRESDRLTVCVDLPKGASELNFHPRGS